MQALRQDRERLLDGSLRRHDGDRREALEERSRIESFLALEHTELPNGKADHRGVAVSGEGEKPRLERRELVERRVEPRKDLGEGRERRLPVDAGHEAVEACLQDPTAIDATFVLRADYATWKAVVTGGLDPIGAVMAGRIRLTGPLTTLLMHTAAATALVGAARQVPTRFPDEDP